MGEVYRAFDERLDREVALKLLPAGTLADESARKRFRKEAVLLAKLNHPNIETVHDFDTENGIDFLVMELIPGKPLTELLSIGPLAERDVLRLAMQLTIGLSAAHARGIIHRDLKPGNLMVGPDGHLKILDFGLAQLLHPIEGTESTASITESPSLAGTLPYMAPERLQNEPADERSDIYSAGALLYEMMTEHRPFPETYGPSLIDAILHHAVVPPRQVNPRISQKLEEIVVKALDRDPERRYQSAVELRVDLERLLAPSEAVKLAAPVDRSEAPALEVAHVLFMDIVGYSKLSMDVQQRALRQLQKVVRGTADFSRAQGNDELIRLPTGDGMALVFFGDPEAPVRCALEVSRALRDQPDVRLRMGIHTGPVYRLADINANRNVAGGGINLAQRVMDCGDAGHILVSKSVADILSQFSNWRGSLHDLGDAEVKHGVRVHIYNVFTADAGNPAAPSKLYLSAALKRTKAARWAPLIATTILAASVVLVHSYIALRKHRVAEQAVPTVPGVTPAHLRPSVAVLGFKNLSERSDQRYLSTALSEMTTSELAAGGELRAIPGESVSEMKIDLALPEADSYGAKTLHRIRQNIGCDDVVVGAYMAMGDGRVRVDMNLENATTGELLDSVTEDGDEEKIDDLVSRAGSALRAKLGVGEVSTAEASDVKATLPSVPEAAQLYSEGLAKMRSFDYVAARDSLLKAVAAQPSFPLSHYALAGTWQTLGYDTRARDEAAKAFDLSGRLGTEDRLRVEERYRRTRNEWNKAMDISNTLFESHRDNLEYGLNLADVQTHAGKLQDALATLATLSELPAPVGEDPRISLAEVSTALAAGDFEHARALAAKSEDVARAQGAPWVTAEAELAECIALERLGNEEQAISSCQAGQKAYEKVGDQDGAAAAILAKANVMSEQGQFSAAQITLEEALSKFRHVGDQRGSASASASLAVIAGRRGHFRSAAEMFERALANFREVGDSGSVCLTLTNVGAALSGTGDLAGAEASARDAIAICRNIGDEDDLATAFQVLGEVRYAKGDLNSSMNLWDQAQEILHKTGGKDGLCELYTDEGEALLNRGDAAGAKAKYEQALSIGSEIASRSEIAKSQGVLAELAIEEGQAATAERLASQGIAEFHREGDSDEELRIRALLAQALLIDGNAVKAQREILGARVLSSETDDFSTLCDFRLTTASAQAALGNLEGASVTLEAVLQESTKAGFVPCQFKARLALGETEIKLGHADAGRTLLAKLEQDATAKGFMLIARKAQTAAKN